MVRCLVENGANTDAKDEDGMMPSRTFRGLCVLWVLHNLDASKDGAEVGDGFQAHRGSEVPGQ